MKSKKNLTTRKIFKFLKSCFENKILSYTSETDYILFMHFVSCNSNIKYIN